MVGIRSIYLKCIMGLLNKLESLFALMHKSDHCILVSEFRKFSVYSLVEILSTEMVSSSILDLFFNECLAKGQRLLNLLNVPFV